MLFIFFTFAFSVVKGVDMCISVDAGSSSTTFYIFAWNTSGLFQYPIPQIVWTSKSSKSISTAYYNDHIIDEVFGPLLEEAKIKISEASYDGQYFQPEEIDFFVYFTTAVRSLAPTEQLTVLNRTYEYVRQNSKFNITTKNLDVIDPVEEGIYTWITVNILTQKIGSKDGTYPVASMGTSSTSLVFDFEDNKDTKYEPYKYTVNINSVNHTIYCYTNSHLGIDSGLANHTRSLAAKEGRSSISTPCYLKEYSSVIGNIDITGTSSMENCSNDLSEYTLIRNPSTSNTPYNTFDNGVLPNPVTKPMYATSVFAYAADAFGWDVEKLTLQDEIIFAKEFCQLSESEAKDKYPDVNEKYINVYCAQMTYTNDFLSKGFGVPLDKPVFRIQEIEIPGSKYKVPLDYLYGTVLSRAYGGNLVIKEAKKKFSTVVAVIISVIVAAIVIGVIVFIVLKIRKSKKEKDEEGGKMLQQKLSEQSSSLETIRDPNEPILSV